MAWQLGVPDISSGLAQGVSGAGAALGQGIGAWADRREREKMLAQAGTMKDLGNGYAAVLDGRGGVHVIEKPHTYTPEQIASLRSAGYMEMNGKLLPVRTESAGPRNEQILDPSTGKPIGFYDQGGQRTLYPKVESSPANEKITDPVSGKVVGFYDQAGKQVLYPQRDETAAGKQMTAEQAKRISDLINVKQSLPNLMSAYDKVKDNWTTGPLMGRTPLATMAGANDPNIQSLEAQLDQLTPALARGVFGEVGVLTDADVKRYRALLPSRLHNGKVAQSLFDSLSGKVDETLKGVLEANRDAGYDVSGFDRYLPKAVAPESTSPAPPVGEAPGGVPSAAVAPRSIDGQTRAAALQWAAQNPNDPRAAEIKRRLGAP